MAFGWLALVDGIRRKEAGAFLEGLVVQGGVFFADIAPIPATVAEEASLHSCAGDGVKGSPCGNDLP